MEKNEVQSFLDENISELDGGVFRVANVEEAVDEFEEKGVGSIDEVTHLDHSLGASYRPKNFSGVLTILTEYDQTAVLKGDNGGRLSHSVPSSANMA